MWVFAFLPLSFCSKGHGRDKLTAARETGSNSINSDRSRVSVRWFLLSFSKIFLPTGNIICSTYWITYCLKKRQWVCCALCFKPANQKNKSKIRKVIPVTCRFGRKKSIIACLILAAFSSFGSVLVASEDSTSKGRSSFRGCVHGGRKILVLWRS